MSGHLKLLESLDNGCVLMVESVGAMTGLTDLAPKVSVMGRAFAGYGACGGPQLKVE